MAASAYIHNPPATAWIYGATHRWSFGRYGVTCQGGRGTPWEHCGELAPSRSGRISDPAQQGSCIGLEAATASDSSFSGSSGSVSS